jgi:hypothetical protein
MKNDLLILSLGFVCGSLTVWGIWRFVIAPYLIREAVTKTLDSLKEMLVEKKY